MPVTSIKAHSAIIWILRAARIVNPENGITNNPSESVNGVLLLLVLVLGYNVTPTPTPGFRPKLLLLLLLVLATLVKIIILLQFPP